MVEPVNAPPHLNWLIPPQEKVKKDTGEDRTLGGVARRCLRVEVGPSADQVLLGEEALTSFINHTPARNGLPAVDKYTIVFGGLVPLETIFTPNPKEIRDISVVTPRDLLDCLPNRQHKFMGVIEACRVAVSRGLLPKERWSYLVN